MARRVGVLDCNLCRKAKSCYQVGDHLDVAVTSKIISGFHYCKECIEDGAPSCRRCIAKNCYLIPVTVTEFVMSKVCGRCTHAY